MIGAVACESFALIAISALSPEPTEAGHRGGIRRGNRSGLVRRQPYYKPASYKIAQIDRSGASIRRETPRAAPIRSAERSRRSQQRRQPQSERNERFPIRPEPNIRREAQSDVTEAKANGLRNYAKDQPDYAMRNLLGKPSRIDGDSEIYNIKGTGTPYQASERLVVRYRYSHECGCRVGNWNRQ